MQMLLVEALDQVRATAEAVAGGFEVHGRRLLSPSFWAKRTGRATISVV